MGWPSILNLSWRGDDHGTSVVDARDRLADLIDQAEAGDEVILTRNGHAACG